MIKKLNVANCSFCLFQTGFAHCQIKTRKLCSIPDRVECNLFLFELKMDGNQ